MAIDPFSKRPRTLDEWRARARIIESQLEGLTIDELLRGVDKHGQPIGGSGSGEYDPSQPRVPAGHPDGGQWTNKAKAGGERINDPRVLSDATPDNHWIVGADYAAVGHHDTPRQIFRKLHLRPETLREFDKAVSGPLGITVRNPITGQTYKHQYNKEHRDYNKAVGELFNMYIEGLRARGITPELMTPDHAREFRALIHRSQDPRISRYIAMIKFLRGMRLLRGGE